MNPIHLLIINSIAANKKVMLRENGRAFCGLRDNDDLEKA